MSSDYRMQFVKDVEAKLALHYSPEEIALISNVVVKALEGYELTERCTELALRDDINDKLLKRYQACLIVDGKSQNTVRQYANTIRKLSDVLNRPFTEMGTYDIRYFLAMEQERGISNRTLENTRAYISSFFQWMTDDELIPKNPAAKIKPIKYTEEVREPFSEVELDALRGGCRSTKERALIEMLLSTGVRVSELALMEVKDVNLENLSVHVIHGKGSKERITYTTPVAAKHLIAYLKQRKEDGPALFYNKDHGPLCAGGIRKALNVIAKRSGVDHVHPHRFRRTFATNLAKRGMDIQEIQRLLGHSNINTTMVYVRTDDSKVQASYKRYSA